MNEYIKGLWETLKNKWLDATLKESRGKACETIFMDDFAAAIAEAMEAQRRACADVDLSPYGLTDGEMRTLRAAILSAEVKK